jgi:hypothetical protein
MPNNGACAGFAEAFSGEVPGALRAPYINMAAKPPGRFAVENATKSGI